MHARFADVPPPLLLSSPRSHTGLFRHNWLVQNNQVHLATDLTWVFNNATASGGAVFNTETTVVNEGSAAASYAVRTTIIEPTSGTVVGTATSSAMQLAAGDEHTSRVAVSVDKVMLWSVRSPALYVFPPHLVSSS